MILTRARMTARAWGRRSNKINEQKQSEKRAIKSGRGRFNTVLTLLLSFSLLYIVILHFVLYFVFLAFRFSLNPNI